MKEKLQELKKQIEQEIKYFELNTQELLKPEDVEFKCNQQMLRIYQMYVVEYNSALADPEYPELALEESMTRTLQMIMRSNIRIGTLKGY